VRTLTVEQKELVARNMGLVSVHVRKQLRRLPPPIRARELEDIFQEGLVGLIEAAIRYQPQRHGPFAAYALAYIHGAVSRYLLKGLDGLAVPASAAKKFARQRKARGREAAEPLEALPQVVDFESARSELFRRACKQARAGAEPFPAAAGSRCDPGTAPPGIRAAYEQAVRLAAETLKASKRGRADRSALIDAFVEERLLVPDEDYRTAKRALARRFACSLGRINDCEERLLGLIRRFLRDGRQLRPGDAEMRSPSSSRAAASERGTVRQKRTAPGRSASSIKDSGGRRASQRHKPDRTARRPQSHD